ncbi:hypothetical protein A3A93_02890 [Candidatus Roizmanbacteria bacterium RIFCSPLOWO2_01_FULL_38_12]|uniref:ATP synthase gamma chain n=1 Tax=Candidatus Roizmanbacteria bacterium RIFCSPLOWO2_01_FULL_38_12 TaxID=1802061 RepID=A0A1F7IZG6_9BACT|nr:MAG: hypothetical protein A3F59_05980 [Candidatus Roizmanbacteria bacterium RIFCSPHIGHO2_12_FULL_38_13]OGK48753.1 MAG: hypothetical protein A3A93_02890 [Candidatus Roizmanbacteria bacterium RIFCSPLOWO2_01_FULL_38_12]
MQQKSNIINEIEFLEDLRQLAHVYETISTIKMQQIRESIIQSRSFFAELMDIFQSLQYENLDTINENIATLTEQRGISLKPMATVIITANTKFHGDILRKTFNYFIKKYDRAGDLFVIGKIGRELIQQYKSSINFKEFDISDINFTIQDLKPILFHLLQYKKIHVYYAVFKNLVEQIPTDADIADILKLTPEEIKEQTGKEKQTDFLFEPSGQKIAGFIHNSVIAMLLLQTVSETHLARLASRLNAMDALLQRIDIDVKKLDSKQRRFEKSLQSIKQAERLSGIALW